MSEEKKSEVTEEVKEARKLSMEELEQVTGGGNEPDPLARLLQCRTTRVE